MTTRIGVFFFEVFPYKEKTLFSAALYSSPFLQGIVLAPLFSPNLAKCLSYTRELPARHPTFSYLCLYYTTPASLQSPTK